MKKVLILLLLFCSLFSQAQKNVEYLVFFDKDWKSTKNPKQYSYFIRIKKLTDSCWTWDYYNFSGPRISSETYKEQRGETPHGFFAYYNSAGYLDSCGDVFENKKDGIWTYFSGDSGKVYLRKHYNKGILYKTDDYSKIDSEEENQADSKPFVTVDVESEFTGGLNAWSNYLTKNLRYPDRAINIEAQGQVWILFEVDIAGKATNLTLAKSVEYTIDEEALRIIRQSPDWVPATQNGRKVRSFKKQPINFMLTE